MKVTTEQKDAIMFIEKYLNIIFTGITKSSAQIFIDRNIELAVEKATEISID